MSTITESETRTEDIARELLTVRGWDSKRPPKGNLLRQNEYRKYSHLIEAFANASKSGDGPGYPDFLVVDSSTIRPLIVVETKAQTKHLSEALADAEHYANALKDSGYDALIAGIAGTDAEDVSVEVQKKAARKWKPIEYGNQPIRWIPKPDEVQLLLSDADRFDLEPQVPSPEILATRGEQINRILRECDITDAHRPRVVGAIMLAIAETKGKLRLDPEHVLTDVNIACEKAFQRSGKYEIADAIRIDEANEKFQSRAPEIVRILCLLNVSTLSAAHDYLGQLYESFFRFTGGNTIGQYFTPRHITQLMAEFVEVSKNDTVVDPACGTGGFLIAALSKMLGSKMASLSSKAIGKFVESHVMGFESEPVTAALCVANMILRGDGNTGIVKGDCFVHHDYPLGTASVVLGNPPFPHARTDEPAEDFVDRGLEALQTRGTLAMVVPCKLLNDRNKADWRRSTIQKHTLKAAISLPSELFQPYASSTTAIIVIEKGIPHGNKDAFFCKITNDGLELRKKVRVPIPGGQLDECLASYRQRLSKQQFCGWSRLNSDEWHPGEYVAGLPLTNSRIKKEVADVIRNIAAFHAFNAENLSHLFNAINCGKVVPVNFDEIKPSATPVIEKRKGKLGRLFDIYYGDPKLETKRDLPDGIVPIIASSGTNNGCFGFRDIAKRTLPLKPPVVTVPRTGSIGQAAVQLTPCGISSDALILIPKTGTAEADLFIAAAILRLQTWRFDYSRKMTPERIAWMQSPGSKALKQWVEGLFRPAWSAMQRSVKVLAINSSNDWVSKFTTIADRWSEETEHLSAMSRMAMHPDYQQIIGMGVDAVPLLLDRLQKKPDRWFWALRAITGENPVSNESQGKMDEMIDAWMEWGRERGYVA